MAAGTGGRGVEVCVRWWVSCLVVGYVWGFVSVMVWSFCFVLALKFYMFSVFCLSF